MSITLGLVLLLGLSYAFFTLTLTGTKQNVIKVGQLKLDLSEDSEGLQLDAALPIYDHDALETNGYQFTLTNNGTIPNEYKVTFDYNLVEQTNTTEVLSQYGKFALKKNGKIILLDNVIDLDRTDKLLDLGIMEPGESNSYELYLWIDGKVTTDMLEYDDGGDIYSSYNDQLTGTIKVTGSQLRERSLVQAIRNYLQGSNTNSVADEGSDHYLLKEVYLWYSGKLWKVVKYDDDGYVKAITNSPQTTLPWGSSLAYRNSNVRTWVNDTSSNGFLGNLYNYENFIVTDASWDSYSVKQDVANNTKVYSNHTSVSDPVGIISYKEVDLGCPGIGSTLLTPNCIIGYSHSDFYLSDDYVNQVMISGKSMLGGTPGALPTDAYSNVSPSVVFRNDLKVIAGSGSEYDPFILKGDQREKGSLLNTSVSGEYVAIGDNQNTIYRVAGKTNGKTQVVIANPLVETYQYANGNFYIDYIKASLKRNKYSTTGDQTRYDATSTEYPIAYFLNHDFLNTTKGYFTKEDLNMMEPDQTWELTTLAAGQDNYKSASKVTSTATVGFLKVGDQMVGDQNEETNYSYGRSTLPVGSLLLTNNGSGLLSYRSNAQNQNANTYDTYRPSFYLKSNVKIKSGRGTRYDPYILTME